MNNKEKACNCKPFLLQLATLEDLAMTYYDLYAQHKPSDLIIPREIYVFDGYIDEKLIARFNTFEEYLDSNCTEYKQICTNKKDIDRAIYKIDQFNLFIFEKWMETVLATGGDLPLKVKQYVLDKIVFDIKSYNDNYCKMESDYIKFLEVIKTSLDMMGVK